MEHVVLVLDESGAKGYSDNAECAPGELGVMAGYLLPNSSVCSIKAEFDAIRGRYFSERKIHITDLSPQEQKELRRNIFESFIENQIYWVYEAVYVQGFFENSNFLNQLTKKAHDSRRSDILVSWKAKRDLLHSELFQGIFGKAVAFCMDNAGNQFRIEVITDRIDDEIIKEFKRKADEFLNFGKEKTYKTTGFNKTTKQVVSGSITSKIVSGISALGDFSGVSYSISCEESSLTLAADVLANSINHHLKLLQAEKVGVSLNNEKAISGHKLSSLVYGAWNDDQDNYFTDAIFGYPQGEKK